jgi:transcriptional regulator with XRE-family HTH domain
MNKPEEYTSKAIEGVLDKISPIEEKKTEKRMLISARIYDAMIKKGWKKKDFAEKIGKKPSVITKWLSGTHNFTFDTLFDIEELLDIKLLNAKEKPISVVKYHFVVRNAEPVTTDNCMINFHPGLSSILRSSKTIKKKEPSSFNYHEQ